MKVGDLVQDKNSLNTVYLVTGKTSWAFKLQCLNAVTYRAVRFSETKEFKEASDLIIRRYIEDWLYHCLINNFSRGL